MWLARSKDGILYGYLGKPQRNDEFGEWEDLETEYDYHPFPFLFEYDTRKDITWENSPKELVVKGE